MKKLFTLASFMAVATLAFGQAPLPNGSFESWETVNLQLDPAGYYTPDSTGFVENGIEIVSQSLDARTGQYAVKLSTVFDPINQTGFMYLGNSLQAGIAFTGRPTKIRGWYKSALGSELATMQLNFLANGNPVGSADNPFTGDTANWTMFEQTITYLDTVTPDRLLLNFVMAGSASGDLFLDDLEFVYGSVGVENISAHSVSMYPNPSNGLTHLATDAALQGAAYTVTDLIGRTVIDGVIDRHVMPLSLSSKGIFVVSVTAPTGRVVYRNRLTVL